MSSCIELCIDTWVEICVEQCVESFEDCRDDEKDEFDEAIAAGLIAIVTCLTAETIPGALACYVAAPIAWKEAWDVLGEDSSCKNKIDYCLDKCHDGMDECCLHCED